jgi:hypothetical protein
VKCQRVIIEVGGGTFTLDLHPRLTVIAGLGAAERESLAGELLGALGGYRTGVHLELRDEANRHLAVLRPKGGRHRVLDVTDGSDVSHEFVGAGGEIDLLARAGLDPSAARAQLRVTSADLATAVDGHDEVRALARRDLERLWSVAQELRDTEQALALAAESFGATAPDQAVVERIEERHRHLEHAIARDERARRSASVVGAAAALLAVPAAALAAPMSLPLLGITGVAMAYAQVCRTSTNRATQAEEAVLSEAGAQSYLGFHLQRVNGMLASAEIRRSLAQAAESHQAAREAWRELAEGTDVGWALAHRDEIESAALLERELQRLDEGGAVFASLRNLLGANLAHSLLARLSTARRLGPSGGSSLPIVLDDALGGLDPALKPALLELLVRAAGHPQVLLLTDDDDVAEWARVEAMTGDVAIIEAAPEPTPAARIDLGRA